MWTFSQNSVLPVLIFTVFSLFIDSRAKGQLVSGRCFLRCRIPLEVDVKCGSNGVSYQNKEELFCAKKLCYPDLFPLHAGRCEEEVPAATRGVTGSGLRKPLPSHANNLPSSLTFDPAAHAPWRTRPQPISKTAKKKEEPSFEDAPLEIAALESQPTPTHRNSENELIPPSALGVDCLQDCVCGFTLLPVCGSNRITYGNQCILECVKNACEPDLEFHHEGFCGKIFFTHPSKKLAFFRLYSAEKGIFQ